MLRSSHSTWPVDVSQIKQGFIVVKGHSTVGLQHIASLPFPIPTAAPGALPVCSLGDVEDNLALTWTIDS